eukprot:TRINITY_DN14855_c0_g1_i1.p1 TRINITY_DN14855_c0_g1~~TRINITY_DN14855_c0_g1_i1.p1  ORF type:complete len:203 (-),score=40.66 TRINITY_DN14855_c0_g1_i1:64-672(-)
MVSHNNVVPESYYRKHWKDYVKNKFNQPARKKKRALRRKQKAAAIFPRPIGQLRPIIRCPTLAKNRKVRLGRGFTLEELKEAGLGIRYARTVGIGVDLRRRNSNEEQLKINTERLKLYTSKLLVFPRKPKQHKKGDSTKEELAKAVQQKRHFGLEHAKVVSEIRTITKEEKAFSANETIKAALEEKKKADIEFGKKLNQERS